MRAWYKRCGTTTARTLVLPELVSTTIYKASCAALFSTFKLKIAVESIFFSVKSEYKSMQFSCNSSGFRFRYKCRFSLRGHHQTERNCVTEEHDELNNWKCSVDSAKLQVQAVYKK